MKTFWMVIGEDSDTTSKRHESVTDANNEAERLSKKELKRFYILKTTHFCEPDKPDIVWQEV